MARRKMTEEQRAANRAKKTAKMRERMRGIHHRLFGNLSPEPAPGTVFDPLAYLTCPGRFRDVRAFFRYRAARAGVGAGLPREMRAAALDEAAQNGLDFFTGRDYAAACFDADAAALAVLSAARWCDRARWRSIDADRAFENGPTYPGDYVLWNRAASCQTAGVDPARAVAAAESLGMSWEDTFPAIHENPGPAVALPGGPSGRGETDGKMVRDGGKIRWRMKRGRGRAKRYEPGIVRDSIPGTPPRYVPGPRPTEPNGPIGWRSLPGETVGYAVDQEAYQEALRGYYAGE